jgi:hypothetical protein
VGRCGIPHLAKDERDAPNFLHAALDKAACAPFFKERRMKSTEPTTLHRKSGMWGTRGFLRCDRVKRSLGFARLFRPTYAGANVGHPSYSSQLRSILRFLRVLLEVRLLAPPKVFDPSRLPSSRNSASE